MHIPDDYYNYYYDDYYYYNDYHYDDYYDYGEGMHLMMFNTYIDFVLEPLHIRIYLYNISVLFIFKAITTIIIPTTIIMITTMKVRLKNI